MAGEMQKAVEDYAKEYAKEYAEEREEKLKIEFVNNLMKDNISLDEALKYAQIDKATYEKYLAQLDQD